MSAGMITVMAAIVGLAALGLLLPQDAAGQEASGTKVPAASGSAHGGPAQGQGDANRFSLRNGLDNSRATFEHKRAGRVVFLGGSITASPGWRDLICADLNRRFPATSFQFINAGVPSLGSTPHAFRLTRDVLARGDIDLLFVEAAVNDELNGQTGIEQLRGMEGIVRQVRQARPTCDVVMMHFADPGKVAAYQKGLTPEVIVNHEKVAAHYGVPSVNLAREVVERIAAGEFTWANGVGGVHPSRLGHQLYAQGIARMLDAAWAAASGASSLKPCPLPDRPLDQKSYFRGRLADVRAASLADGWTLDPNWRPADGVATRGGFVGVAVLVAQRPGATLTFAFEGTGVGVFVASGPDAGTIEYRVDDKPVNSRNLYTQWSRTLHLPWAQVLDADLAPGRHVLELRVAEAADPSSKGHAVRIVHFLVN